MISSSVNMSLFKWALGLLCGQPVFSWCGLNSGHRERSWFLQDGRVFSEMSWVLFGQPVLKSLKNPLQDGVENPTGRKSLGCYSPQGDTHRMVGTFPLRKGNEVCDGGYWDPKFPLCLPVS